MTVPSPMGMLKVVAALTPLMGNKEVGEAMVNEIKSLFEAMQNIDKTHTAIAAALISIDRRLAGIEEKLQGMKLPLSEGETHLLLEHQINGRDISNG